MEEFNCTLAHKRNNKIDLQAGAYIQPKLDGVRCYTRFDRDTDTIRMYSRNHKEFYNCKHITTQLYPILKHYPELTLDGELYNHRFKDNFNKIISLVRKQKPSQQDKFESASYLQYHVYDVFNASSPKSVYLERNHWINHIFNYKYRKFNTRAIQVVKTYDVENEIDVEFHENRFLHAGYEGAMLRANIPYEQKRSHGLQKVKRFNDSEFIITGFVKGKGKFTGGLGKFLGLDNYGRQIEVPYQKCTIEERKEIWENREAYFGKVATFEWFERTPAGAYRFPSFKSLRNYE